MIAVLVFLAVLSVLVLIHEFGHFFAAKLCGVKAEEFGYGFPPRMVGWKKNGTIWSLNWLPLGGFVRLKGERGEDGGDPDSFLSKGPLARGFILVAGVAMNWILAALIFMLGFGIGVPAETDGLPDAAIVRDRQIQITEVLKGSAAERAGIASGDFLVAVNGQSVTLVKDAQALFTATPATEPRSLSLRSGNAAKVIDVTPSYLEELKRPGLGVAMANTGIVRFPWPQAIDQGLAVTAAYTKLIIVSFAGLIRDVFVRHRLTSEVSGPVGIAVMTGQIAQQGWWPVLQFAALLSLNLAVINFLPIPALDGGRALFVLIESLRRKRTNPRFEAALHQIGFVALLVLVTLVTVRDLQHYGGMILGGLKSIVGL